MFDSLHIPKEDIHSVERALSAFNSSPELMAAFSKKSLKVRCKDDEILFRIGESGGSVFLVRSGEVELTLPFSSVAASPFRQQQVHLSAFQRRSAMRRIR